VTLNGTWRKSSRSHINGCVEARWVKAASSNVNGCVEVCIDGEGTVQIRDSKLGDASPILQFTPQEWACFLDGVKDGEFDVPGPPPLPRRSTAPTAGTVNVVETI
jgi:hypothetical protein